jgi:hypothetical protein
MSVFSDFLPITANLAVFCKPGGFMPLLFDISFDDLPAYRGTNPRPADFDEFWQICLMLRMELWPGLPPLKNRVS